MTDGIAACVLMKSAMLEYDSLLPIVDEIMDSANKLYIKISEQCERINKLMSDIESLEQ